MVKANELRIGNWIDWIKPDPKPTYEKVYAINDGEINECHPKEYNPIPLTPEILEMCGFTKSDGNFKIDVGELKDSNVFCLNIETGLYIVQDYFINATTGGKCRIKSLHQLQNLFFALTGEELTVDLQETLHNQTPQGHH